MATCVLEKTVILHTPKTGGNWIAAALTRASITFKTLPERHATLLAIRRDFPRHRTVAFVRNPVTWWQSYWRYRMMTQWEPDHPVDKKCQAGEFPRFMENVLRHCPDYCSDLLESYVGPPSAQVDFIGKFENLKADFVTSLSPEYLIDRESIDDLGHINQSDHSFPAPYTSDLLLRLYRADERSFLRFGYALPRIESLSSIS